MKTVIAVLLGCALILATVEVDAEPALVYLKNRHLLTDFRGAYTAPNGGKTSNTDSNEDSGTSAPTHRYMPEQDYKSKTPRHKM